MSVCQIEERDAGRPYPRTCPTCKLTGPCAKGLDRKAMAASIEALTAENERLHQRIADDTQEIRDMQDNHCEIVALVTSQRDALAEKLATVVQAALDEFAKDHDWGDRTGEFVHRIVNQLRPRLIAALKEGGE